MANPEIRLGVQRALDKLVNRFGTQGDVIGELRAALRLMERAEVPASNGEREAPPVSPAPAETVEKAEPQPTARKRTGKAK